MRPLQGLLGAQTLGDVDREHDDPEDLAVLAAIWDLVGADPALLSGSGCQDLDDAQLRCSAADDLEIVSIVLLRLLRVEVVYRASLDLLDRHPPRLRCQTVGAQDAILTVLVPDERRHRVGEHLHVARGRKADSTPASRSTSRGAHCKHAALGIT